MTEDVLRPTVADRRMPGEECLSAGRADDAAPRPRALSGIRDLVLVASGKGGVGKSTVTVNLAAALERAGLRVGVLDADIFGPSVALLLGTEDGLAVDEAGGAVPASSHGIASVSLANVVPPETALAWKGPMVSQALMQLFEDVAWPALDLLLVDLPPGTGDVQLTILEQVPVTGAIVVTTPQRLATIDAERAIGLFHEVDLPVFGVVENMAGYVCPCCGALERPYGKSDVGAMARERHVAHLGEIPLEPAAAKHGEAGLPMVLAAPQSPIATAFDVLAQAVLGALVRERLAAEHAAADGGAREAFWEHLLDE